MTNYYAANTATDLGQNHGYCLDGDYIHLNADVCLADSDVAAGESWALQLWASVDGFEGLTLNGVKVAELALDSIAGCFNVAGCVPALPPAGDKAQTMAMALVGQTSDGVAIVRSLSVYPKQQLFLQPFLDGAVRCELKDGSAEIAIGGIVNPRDAGNLSGTLALEVWAMDVPYAGGSWVGTPVASLVLGVLAGGEAWSDCQYSVPAVTTNPGAALTVMLREWTPAGYVTRDYRNLPAAPVAVAPVAAAPAKAKKAAAKIEKKSEVKVAKDVEAPKKAEKKADKKSEAKPEAAKDTLVSVNKASVAELAAIKGVTKGIAEAIVAARPYAALNDVLRAKGVGPKLLEKVGKLLKV